jgi:dihydroxyacetone kinase-like predicted kinase
VSAAQQAATVSSKPLSVVPTTSIPHGIAALLAFNPDADVQTNVARMQEAVAGVRSGEVTTAVRSTSVNGVAVREGQAIAMLDGEMVAAAETVTGAAQELFRRAAPASGSLATLYWGGDAREGDAGELAAWIAANFPEVETEVVHGGQPLYHYLVSLE